MGISLTCERYSLHVLRNYHYLPTSFTTPCMHRITCSLSCPYVYSFGQGLCGSRLVIWNYLKTMAYDHRFVLLIPIFVTAPWIAGTWNTGKMSNSEFVHILIGIWNQKTIIIQLYVYQLHSALDTACKFCLPEHSCTFPQWVVSKWSEWE